LEPQDMMERRTFADREDVLGAVMLAPALAYVIVLVGVPFALAIILSFSNATAGSLSFGWAGLGNYAAILGDPIFLRALRNSAVVTVGTQLLVVILATAAAQVFRATFRGKRFARFVLLLPWAVLAELGSALPGAGVAGFAVRYAKGRYVIDVKLLVEYTTKRNTM